MEIIKIENLTFKYPECEKSALSSASLSINEGDFVTICGKSGCGKSTLLRQLKPILSPHGTRSGNISLRGRDLFSLSQREQCESIGFVMQDPDNQIVTDKVWHELAFGLEGLAYSNTEIRARVSEMASFFGLESWFHKSTSELSGGQKQLLNLASVMVMQPDLLILDEPTSQLDPIAASEFLEILSKINRELGTTVILSEHRLEDAFPISDKVAVMEDGRVIAYASPDKVGEILKNSDNDMLAALPTPMRVYYSMHGNGVCPVTIRDGRAWLMGMSPNTALSFEKSTSTKNDIAAELRDIWIRYEKNSPDVISGLSMKVEKGSVYAIVGGNGAGKTTLLSAVSGNITPYRGKVNVFGKASMLPQNPKVLFTNKTVLSDLEDMHAEKTLLESVISLCELNELLNRHPYDLSGGEQQRVGLAKVLLTSPDILLLDEPTKGLDAHFKEKLAEILKKLSAGGMTVIMVSHDIEFCARFADRCGMLFDGRLTSEDAPRAFFAGKSFYTTAANRMARNIIPNAVLPEDIIAALGGKTEKKEENIIPIKIAPKKEEAKKSPGLTAKNIVTGVIFAAAFILLEVLTYGKLAGCKSYLVQAISILTAGLSLFNFIPQGALGNSELSVTQDSRKLSKRTLLAAFLILLTIPLTIFAGMLLFDDRRYYFISMLIILQTLLPFALIFEKRKPKARELIIISVLSAIAVAGRCAFSMLPQFKPVLAMVIITGVCFGGESGFLVGAVTAFVSNFYLSQGPWTPWQMLAMGIVGFIAGILFKKGFIRKTRLSLCIFGGISAIVIYGGIMNPASVLMYYSEPTPNMLLASYISGLPMDIIHAVSTVFFLWFGAPPMLEKLERIKVKYGLIE